MDKKPPCEAIREQFIDLLHLLGSAEQQREYQREVGWVHTPTEMICMFLDDRYCPDDAHWTGCFLPSELEVLRGLEEVIKTAADDVSHKSELAELLTTAPWQRMMREARRVAEFLTPGTQAE